MVSEVESSDTDGQRPAPNQPSEAEEEDATSAKLPDRSTSARTAEAALKSVFSCTDCGLTFRKRDHFDRHRFVHTGVKGYRCPEPDCPKEYTNRTHLNRHIRSNHTEKPALPATVFHCKHPTCEKVFHTNQNMRRHYEQKHVHGKSWTCAECGEKFWRKLQLKQHSFKHTGQYPHRCDICDKGFMSLATLRNHRTTHALHKCDSCPAEFTRWTNLVAHRKLEHATSYQCDICQGKFRSKRNLKEHAKVHRKASDATEEEQQVFQCPHEGCPKFYDYERNLVAHISSKHEGTRKFVCTVEGCGRALVTKQKLQQHMRLHESAAQAVSGMKPPAQRKKKPAARRKDSGVPRRSRAAQLANVALDARSEKLMLEADAEGDSDARAGLELECPPGGGGGGVDSASESEVESSARVSAILDGQLAKIQERIRQMQEQRKEATTG